LAGILLRAATEPAIRGDFFPIAAVNCRKFPALARQGAVPGYAENFAVAAGSFCASREKPVKSSTIIHTLF
jgi:hypothetical protein